MANLWSRCYIGPWCGDSSQRHKGKGLDFHLSQWSWHFDHSSAVPSGALPVCGWGHWGPDRSAPRPQPLERRLRHRGCAGRWQALLPAAHLPQQQERGAVRSQAAAGCVSQRWGIVDVVAVSLWMWYGQRGVARNTWELGGVVGQTWISVTRGTWLRGASSYLLGS